MTMRRGEIWLANLNPTRGSEQAGIRPVLIFQTDLLNRFVCGGLSTTVPSSKPHVRISRIRLSDGVVPLQGVRSTFYSHQPPQQATSLLNPFQ
ncbi:MAG: type II toxin-antitoxin system PemK/MazF family toxin [Halobacteriota archaeon]